MTKEEELAQRRAHYRQNAERLRLESLARQKAKGEAGLARRRELYALNKERELARMKAQYEKNPEKMRQRAAAWRKANPDKVHEIHIAYIKKHPEQKGRDWKNHPDRVNERTAKRRAAKSKAVSKWRNQFFIEEAYLLARMRSEATGVMHQVDHIVPLQNANVCGLHNEFNLQVVPMKINARKGNKHWPQMDWVLRKDNECCIY